MLKVSAEVQRVPIDKIVVGVRRRQKLGNLRSLAKSIEVRNLLHPILLRNGNELVAGQRRLEACKLLGWTTIPARFVEKLDDDDLRAVELEENTERLALANYELSKARLAEIRQAEADLRVLPDSGKTGRPPKRAASRRAVAEVTGISRTSQQETERHVEIAERYPVFQRPDWKQHNVMEADEALEKLPERDRSKAAALLDQDGIPPKKAIAIIENMVEMASAERQEIFKLAASDDAHNRRVALTTAAALPPPPDPASMILSRMHRDGEKAVKVCRVERLRPQIEGLVEKTADLIKRLDVIHKGA